MPHDAKELRHLHLEMLRIRMIEERIAERYADQEMRCPVHLSIGQEGAAVAACAAVTRRDHAMSSHRSHAHYLAKGGDLRGMVAELYGKATGVSGGMGGSMHLVDLEAGFLGATPIVGATIPIAVGAALGASQKGEDRVVLAFLGDGACETGAFHEAANFAVLRSLPVIFLCENNLYSVYSPLAVRQPDRPLHRLAEGYGLAASHGDGNDVVAAKRLCEAAVARARAGEGPSFIELATYRWLEHCGPNYDNHIGYRTEAEFLTWKERDPLARLEGRLISDGLLSGEEVEGLRAKISGEIDDAFRFAFESPFPTAIAPATGGGRA